MIAAAAPLRGHPPGLRQQPHRHELQLPYLRKETLLISPCQKARAVGWQRHLGGGEPVDHADRLVLWQLAAAYRVSNEPEGAVDFDVVTPGGTRSCPLVDDRNSTVHAGPGQGCRLAVIAFRPAAEFGLVVGESDDLLDFGQLDYLDPRQADGGGEGGML